MSVLNSSYTINALITSNYMEFVNLTTFNDIKS
jgi:hypothetical protein